MSILFLSVFSAVFCGVLYSMSDTGVLFQIDSTNGNILKNGTFGPNPQYIPFAVKTNSEGACDLIIAVVRDSVYHVDCETFQETGNYKLYDKDQMTDDLFYDNTNGILFGIRQKVAEKKSEGFEIVYFDPPSGLRKHYTVHKIGDYKTDGAVPLYVQGSYDEQNLRIVMSDIHYYKDFGVTATFLADIEWNDKEKEMSSGEYYIPRDLEDGVFFSILPGGVVNLTSHDSYMYYSTNNNSAAENSYIVQMGIPSFAKQYVAKSSSNSVIFNGIVAPDGNSYVGQSVSDNGGYDWNVCDFESQNCQVVASSLDTKYNHKMLWTE